MNSQLVCVVPTDVFNSERRLKDLDEIMGYFHGGSERVFMRKGNEWYSYILLTSMEIPDREVDNLIQAYHNACEIANRISEGYSQEAHVNPSESEDFSDLDNTQALYKVEYEDGIITFILQDEQDMMWLALEEI